MDSIQFQSLDHVSDDRRFLAQRPYMCRQTLTIHCGAKSLLAILHATSGIPVRSKEFTPVHFRKYLQLSLLTTQLASPETNISTYKIENKAYTRRYKSMCKTCHIQVLQGCCHPEVIAASICQTIVICALPIATVAYALILCPSCLNPPPIRITCIFYVNLCDAGRLLDCYSLGICQPHWAAICCGRGHCLPNQQIRQKACQQTPTKAWSRSTVVVLVVPENMMHVYNLIAHLWDILK